MNGGIDFITLISLIVAVVAVLALRSVLGRRTGDEESRIERYRSEAGRAEAPSASDKVVTLPRRNRDEPLDEPGPDVTAAEAQEKIAAYAKSNTALERGLMEILQRDPNFDPEHFVTGAKQAYEMIVTAFAEGNRRMLKELLDRDVLDGFVAAIADRESRGEQVDQSFVGIDKAEILAAQVDDKGTASVTMKFVSQLITATHDRSGAVISGDSQRIMPVTDIWTFARDVSSRRAVMNPNWRLIETQNPE